MVNRSPCRIRPITHIVLKYYMANKAVFTLKNKKNLQFLNQYYLNYAYFYVWILFDFFGNLKMKLILIKLNQVLGPVWSTDEKIVIAITKNICRKLAEIFLRK